MFKKMNWTLYKLEFYIQQKYSSKTKEIQNHFQINKCVKTLAPEDLCYNHRKFFRWSEILSERNSNLHEETEFFKDTCVGNINNTFSYVLIY